MDLHNICEQHLNSASKWYFYIQTKNNGSIITLMSNAWKDTIIKNYEYIKAIIDVLLLIAC